MDGEAPTHLIIDDHHRLALFKNRTETSISGDSMVEFISEDELLTFDGWLKYQGADPASAAPEELAMLRELFDETMERVRASPKVGLMNLRSTSGERRYAVAIQDGSDLWLTLWVRCAPKGDVYVLIPRGDRDWNPHTSYHRDGRFHSKSYDHVSSHTRSQRQPLTAGFQGSEHLGSYGGHGKRSGAECDPAAFEGVVTVPPGLLGPRDGSVVVDLVQPGSKPRPDPDFPIREVFRRDPDPAVVITVVSTGRSLPVLRWPSDFVPT